MEHKPTRNRAHHVAEVAKLFLQGQGLDLPATLAFITYPWPELFAVSPMLPLINAAC